MNVFEVRRRRCSERAPICMVRVVHLAFLWLLHLPLWHQTLSMQYPPELFRTNLFFYPAKLLLPKAVSDFVGRAVRESMISIRL